MFTSVICCGSLLYSINVLPSSLHVLGSRDYPVDFKKARSHFSNSGSSSNRILLLLSHGLVGISEVTSNDFQANNPSITFNSFEFKIYTANRKLL